MSGLVLLLRTFRYYKTKLHVLDAIENMNWIRRRKSKRD